MLLSACDWGNDFDNARVVANGDVFTLTADGDTVASLPRNGPAVDEAEAELGWLLFWDPVLSGAGDVACATCHLPEWGYADGLRTSIGVGGEGRGPDRTPHPAGLVGRNSPGIVNAVFNGIDDDGSYNPATAPMFWDNRASGFAEQAMGPVRSDVEMRGDAFPEDQIWDEVVFRVNDIPEYRERFETVYGEPASAENIVQAIAAFESTLVATNTPFDRWMRGDDNALTPRQLDGLEAFFEAECVECHSGPMFSDFETHVLAAPDGPTVTEVDMGDGEFAFRTPSLRQLDFTGPYFHGGHANDVEDAVEFYRAFDDGGGDGGGGGGGDGDDLNPDVPRNRLDDDVLDVDLERGQIQAITAFLEALNDPDFFVDEPDSVPSGLPVGGFE